MSLANKLEYIHFYNQVPLDFDWENKFQAKLISSVEELALLLSGAKGKIMSMDTETSGLDFGRDEIVGFSFSFDAWSGYYVPIRHINHWITEAKIEKIDNNLICYTSTSKNKLLKLLSKTKETTPESGINNCFLEAIITCNSHRHTHKEDLNILECIISKIESNLNYTLSLEDLEKLFPLSLDVITNNRHILEPLYKKVKVNNKSESEANLDPKQCLDLLFEAMSNAHTVIAHNAIFDFMMLKREGYNPKNINIFDTMTLTYNIDSNAVNMRGLKQASEHFLGRRALKFKEVLGKEKTFKHVEPSKCYAYASYDSGNTFGLFNVLYPTLKSENCESIINLDNKLVKSFIDYYTDNELYIDKKVMQEYKHSIEKRIGEIELSIFSAVGYPFNINSKAKELPLALQSLGIDTGVKTETGIMSTSKEALNGVIDKHPIIKELMEMNSLNKQLNTYIDKLSKCESLKDNSDVGVCRIQYKLFGTSTGRLSSGTGNRASSDEEDADYFINLNIQNLTKPKPAIYEAKSLGDISKGILGWDFTLIGSPSENNTRQYISDNPEAYFVEGFSPELNVRKAIRVKDDSELILSIDYSAQEIKLAGIITGEPNFIEPFKKGEDVHTNMAKKLFGEENYDKSKRKSAKIANFGLLYGGNPMVLKSVAEQQGDYLTEEQAKDLYDRWWKANSTLKIWKDYMLERVRGELNFTVKDLFGRPRRLRHYLTSGDRGVFNYGVRNITSHSIQGTGSSIMRQVLINLCSKIFTNTQFSKEVSFVSAVHDEGNYRVKKPRFTQWAKVIEDIMVFNPPNFPIPIDCSLEVGTSLGYLFPFVWSDNTRTKLIPKRA